jgi:multicomponent Na+:H+ antiporter subunit C
VSPSLLHFGCGVAIFAIGLHGLITHRDLFRKILSVNVMGSGVFVVLIAAGRAGAVPDRVPEALVLTGIVVAISATAFALTLARRLFELTGRAELPEEADGKDEGHG